MGLSAAEDAERRSPHLLSVRRHVSLVIFSPAPSAPFQNKTIRHARPAAGHRTVDAKSVYARAVAMTHRHLCKASWIWKRHCCRSQAQVLCSCPNSSPSVTLFRPPNRPQSETLQRALATACTSSFLLGRHRGLVHAKLFASTSTIATYTLCFSYYGSSHHGQGASVLDEALLAGKGTGARRIFLNVLQSVHFLAAARDDGRFGLLAAP